MSRRPEDRVARSEEFAFLGALAAGLAHEIRNPLSTMTVNLQLLQEDFQQSTTPQGQRANRKIEILLQETRRLEHILNDFMRFAGRLHFTIEDQDLSELMEEVLDFLEADLRKNNVRVVRRLGRGLPLVSIDRNLFRQAVLNILINARQAMPSGGELSVRTYAADGREVGLEIADTGIGIEAQELDRIFTVFYSTKKDGTGLGLPIAKRIIEELDGHIDVRSEPARGTVFTILLPRAGGDIEREE